MIRSTTIHRMWSRMLADNGCAFHEEPAQRTTVEEFARRIEARTLRNFSAANLVPLTWPRRLAKREQDEIRVELARLVAKRERGL